MQLVLDLTLQGLINGAIYALIAVGLVMVYGLLRILHIAHAGLFTPWRYIGLVRHQCDGEFFLVAAGGRPDRGQCGHADLPVLLSADPSTSPPLVG